MFSIFAGIILLVLGLLGIVVVGIPVGLTVLILRKSKGPTRVIGLLLVWCGTAAVIGVGAILIVAAMIGASKPNALPPPVQTANPTPSSLVGDTSIPSIRPIKIPRAATSPEPTEDPKAQAKQLFMEGYASRHSIDGLVAMEQAVVLDPGNMSYRMTLADVLLLRDNPKLTARAIDMLHVMLETSPGDDGVLSRLADAYMEMGNYSFAFLYAGKRQPQKGPVNRKAVMQIAYIAARGNRVEQGAAILSGISADHPKDDFTKLFLASLYKNCGKRKECRDLLATINTDQLSPELIRKTADMLEEVLK